MNKSIFSDRELLRRLAMSDTDAFKILFDQYYPILVRVLLRYSKDQEEIKDWIQDIYIKLWEGRESIQWETIDNFKAYFIVISRNYAIKELAKGRRLKIEQLHGTVYEEVMDNSSNNVLEELELKRAYQAAILRLPAKTQKAYVLNRETGLTYRSIAEELGISVKTVESQISRALLLLRQELQVFIH